MKYSLAVFKRALKLYEDKAKDDFYKDMKHLVECQEKELREKYKNLCERRIHDISSDAVAFFIEDLLNADAEEILGQ